MNESAAVLDIDVDVHCYMQASASEAGSQLPSNAKGYLGYVLAHRSDAQILPLIENAVECRTEITQAMTGNRCFTLDPAEDDVTMSSVS